MGDFQTYWDTQIDKYQKDDPSIFDRPQLMNLLFEAAQDAWNACKSSYCHEPKIVSLVWADERRLEVPCSNKFCQFNDESIYSRCNAPVVEGHEMFEVCATYQPLRVIHAGETTETEAACQEYGSTEEKKDDVSQ